MPGVHKFVQPTLHTTPRSLLRLYSRHLSFQRKSVGGMLRIHKLLMCLTSALYDAESCDKTSPSIHITSVSWRAGVTRSLPRDLLLPWVLCRHVFFLHLCPAVAYPRRKFHLVILVCLNQNVCLQRLQVPPYGVRFCGKEYLMPSMRGSSFARYLRISRSMWTSARLSGSPHCS